MKITVRFSLGSGLAVQSLPSKTKISKMTQELFLCASSAEGRHDFLLLYARGRVAALAEILLFGAVTHHAGISNLASLLGLNPRFLCHA
jgi:hypothetical protein